MSIAIVINNISVKIIEQKSKQQDLYTVISNNHDKNDDQPIVNIIQLILNFLIKPKKTKYIYYKIEGLLCSIIGLPSFKRSKYDKD